MALPTTWFASSKMVLLDQRVGFRQLGARIVAGYAHRGLGLQIENDPALNVSSQPPPCQLHPCADRRPLHAEVAYFGGTLQALRQHASAALMKGWISSIFIALGPRAVGIADRAIFSQYVLDDFVQHFRLTGFCTKWRAPRCSAATMFSCSPPTTP